MQIKNLNVCFLFFFITVIKDDIWTHFHKGSMFPNFLKVMVAADPSSPESAKDQERDLTWTWALRASAIDQDGDQTLRWTFKARPSDQKGNQTSSLTSKTPEIIQDARNRPRRGPDHALDTQDANSRAEDGQNSVL